MIGTLCSQPNGIITDQFFQNCNSSLNFNLLDQSYVFSSILITTFFNKLNFKYLIRNQYIDEQILSNYSSCFEPVVWRVLPHYQDLTSQFLQDYQEQLKVKIKPLIYT